jgi:hypothetical protein
MVDDKGGIETGALYDRDLGRLEKQEEKNNKIMSVDGWIDGWITGTLLHILPMLAHPPP